MDNVNILGTEKISKLFMKFSFPAVLGMVVMASYNVVDRIFVGQGVGPQAISGITVTFPMIIVFMAFGMLVGIGATALISIKLGQKKKDEAEQILGNSIILTILISIGLMVLGYIFIDQMLIQFGGSGKTLEYAREYTHVILIGTIFQQISFSMNGVIRAEGSPKMAMATMLVSSILNMILNPIFIFGLHWGIRGSAWATVISQFVGCVWVIYYFMSRNSLLKIRPANLILRKNIIMGIFAIGMSPFAMQIAGSLVNVIFNKEVAHYGGDIGIAVIGIGNSLMMMLFMPIFGVCQGIQPIIGYNYGAKRYDRVKEVVKLGIIVATSICILGFISIMFFSDNILMLFSKKDPKLIMLGTHGLRIFMFMLPLVGFQFISTNFLQSIGKAKSSMILTLSRQILILIPLLLILPIFFALEGVWMSGPIADFLSSLVAAYLLVSEFRKLNNSDENLTTLTQSTNQLIPSEAM